MQAITELRKTAYYIPGFTDQTGNVYFTKDVAVGHARLEGTIYLNAPGNGRTFKTTVVRYEQDEDD